MRNQAKSAGKRLLRLWLWKFRLGILLALIPAILIAIVVLAAIGSTYTPANASGCTTQVQGQYTKTINDTGNGPNINIAVTAYQTTTLRTKQLPPDQAKKVLDSIFQAGLTESGFKNLANSSVPVSLTIANEGIGHNGTSVGYLQQQVGPAGDGGGFSWGTAQQAMDPLHATNMYLDRAIDLVSRTPGDASTLAEAVQESGSGDGSNYREQVDTAQGLIARAQVAAAGPAGAAQQLRIIQACAPAQGELDDTVFSAGNIISDQVFYSTTAMNEAAIRQFIADQGADCTDPACLRLHTWTTPQNPADAYCRQLDGGTGEDSASVIYRVSQACGINPQVMLVTLQKESGLLTRTDVQESLYDAAYGWHCPDTGPGGTANCDPEFAGFINQAYGMAHQWAKYKIEIPKDNGTYNYAPGRKNHILWNVAESGCGGSDVFIRNVATASLYVYTPYQPNPASLAAYPGTGDECSAYGNRNFWFMFRKYFGSTGGGAEKDPTVQGTASGVIIDSNPDATAVSVVNPSVSTALTEAHRWLGRPYCWAGGDAGGPTMGDGSSPGCSPSTPGFDCSGLMVRSWAVAGITLPRVSRYQATTGVRVPVEQARPGDLLFWSDDGSDDGIHHVAMVDKEKGWIVEAQQDGVPVHVRTWRVGEAELMPYAVRLTP